MADQPQEKMADAEAVVKQCSALEVELAELKAAYEQFFLGLARVPPSDAHRSLRTRVLKLQSSFIRQTAAKFKVNSLHATLKTYERLWERTTQQMESGTYRRDVFKARLHEKLRQPPKEQQKEPPQKEQAAPPPQSAPPPSFSEAKLRAVYEAYLTAKRRCNEDVSRLSFDAVAGALKKQLPGLLRQHNAKAVEFKVVIKDGKASLRAVPK